MAWTRIPARIELLSMEQHELDRTDPYQVYIYMMLDVRCASCHVFLDIDPPFGKNDEYSWDWYRVAAEQARASHWWISPFDRDGTHPMLCFCPECCVKRTPLRGKRFRTIRRWFSFD
jgi:hypothetical protein